jgi:hypothetical protein
MKAFRALGAVLCAWLIAMPAFAQIIPNTANFTNGTHVDTQPVYCIGGCASPLPFTVVGSSTPITTGASSANTPIVATSTLVVLTNNGSNDLYYKLGTSNAVTAASTDNLLAVGHSISVGVGSNTYISAISPGGASTLAVMGGTGGSPSLSGGGGGGGSGGAVTGAVGSFLDGWNLTDGSKTDSYCTVYNLTTCSIEARLAAIEKAMEDVTTSSPVKAATATFADGWDITEGLTTDGACAGDNTSGCTVEQRLQRLAQNLTSLKADLDLLALPFVSGNSIVCSATASMTGTTQTSLCAAPGSGLHNYITELTCGNASATIATFVDVEDGSGGTVLKAVPAAISFGGGAFTFPAPGLRQPTANTALFVVNETTGAAVKCDAVGYKGP